MTFEDLLSALPKLTPDERAALRLRLVALDEISTNRAAGDDWFLAGVIYILHDRGLGDTVPQPFRIVNRRQHHGYLPKSEKLRAMFERHTLTKQDELALGRLLARCLAEYIDQFRSVSLSAMLQHVELAVPALDRAFPGYLRAGLVRVMLRGFPRAAGNRER